MLSQENFEIYDSFWWLLRPHIRKKRLFFLTRIIRPGATGTAGTAMAIPLFFVPIILIEDLPE